VNQNVVLLDKPLPLIDIIATIIAKYKEVLLTFTPNHMVLSSFWCHLWWQ